MLAFAFLAAIGVAFWRALLWEPPTHSIIPYEKAPAYYGKTATIGPNQIRIDSIVRNRRDGSILIDADTERSAANIPHMQSLINCASWLDVAQIDLRPGGELVEIIEVRVFDHVTRELLNVHHPWFGHRVVEPNLIHLYGFGKELPDEIDLWMRIHSYNQDDPLQSLTPRLGATAEVAGCEFTVEQLQAGFRGWSAEGGLLPVEGSRHADTGLLLSWKGGAPEARFQVAAIRDDGTKRTHDRLIGGSFYAGRRSALDFPFPLHEITHFEIRPDGGRHRFFFAGLQLPKLAEPRVSFQQAPPATIQTGGKETAITISELAPLDIRFELLDGRRYSGSRAGDGYVQLMPDRLGNSGVGKQFTMAVQFNGLASPPVKIRFRTASDTTKWMSEGAFAPQGWLRAGSESQVVQAWFYNHPLGDIDAVEISLKNFPEQAL